MMKKYRLTAAALLVLLLCTFSIFPVTAGNTDRKLISLLENVPVSAFQTGWLSYADIQALFVGGQGTAQPMDVEEFERLQGTPEEDMVIQAFSALSAGPADLYQNLYQAREMLLSSGIDLFKVHEAMEIGLPPSRQFWLRGDYDREAVNKALSDKGYLSLKDAPSGLDVWGLDGKLDGGMALNLLARDVSFPFGGKLGQSWPVVLQGDLLFSSPDEGAVRAVMEGQEPALADLAPVRDMVQTAGRVSLDETGTLAQLYLLTQTAAGIDSVIQPGTQEEPFPVSSLFFLSHVLTDDAQWVLLGMAYPDAEAASRAMKAMEQQYPEARSVQSGKPISEHVAEMDGRANQPFPVSTKGGSSIVVLPFRFPLESGESPMPFRFFTSLLMTRGLEWLMVSQVGQ